MGISTNQQKNLIFCRLSKIGNVLNNQMVVHVLNVVN